MSEHRFTPGPWRRMSKSSVWGKDAPVAVAICDGKEHPEEFKWDECDQDMMVANTNLIAAAPALLKACETVIETSFEEDDERDEDHLWYRCRECGSSAADIPMAVTHMVYCVVGEAAAAVALALGQSAPKVDEVPYG